MVTPKIISVEALEKYKLKLRVDDSAEGVYEISDLAGHGVFKAWDVDNNFFKVFVDNESRAISWPGEIDIDTVNAYCTIKGIFPEKFFNRSTTYATP